MLKIGITGGIGAGKSLICNLFTTLGIPIYNADNEAKWIILNNSYVKQKIIDLLGTEAYTEDGRYNTNYVSQKVFNDKELLNSLNAIVHPAVGKHSQEWLNGHTNAPYIIREAALLFESGASKLIDKTILVYAPAEIRLLRVLQRDNLPKEQIIKRMASQWSEEEKIKLADHIIYNDGSRSVIKQVWSLHRHFIEISPSYP